MLHWFNSNDELLETCALHKLIFDSSVCFIDKLGKLNNKLLRILEGKDRYVVQLLNYILLTIRCLCCSYMICKY